MVLSGASTAASRQNPLVADLGSLMAQGTLSSSLLLFVFLVTALLLPQSHHEQHSALSKTLKQSPTYKTQINLSPSRTIIPRVCHSVGNTKWLYWWWGSQSVDEQGSLGWNRRSMESRSVRIQMQALNCQSAANYVFLNPHKPTPWHVCLRHFGW